VQSKVDVLGDGSRDRYVGRTLVKSYETDRENQNGYENRSPLFSHERCPTLESSFSIILDYLRVMA